jgi:hypothetical protein
MAQNTVFFVLNMCYLKSFYLFFRGLPLGLLSAHET